MHNFTTDHFQITPFFLRKEWFSNGAIVIILILKHLHTLAIRTMAIVYYFEVTFEILLYTHTQTLCFFNSCNNIMRLNIDHIRKALK